MAEFSEKGFEAARMEDIARRAGISKAGVYLYFRSKEGLLTALIKAKVAPLAQQVRAMAAAGATDPLGALRRIASMAAHQLQDAKVLAVPRLVIAVSGRFPRIAEDYRREVAEVARGALIELIEAAIEQGRIRAVDPVAAARAFIGPLFFEGMWTHVLRGESAEGGPGRLIDSHFDILLNGLEHRA